MSSEIKGMTKFNSYPEAGNTIRVYDRETDELIAETTTESDGAFTINVTAGSGIYYVVAIRESTGETQIYDMVQREVMIDFWEPWENLDNWSVDLNLDASATITDEQQLALEVQGTGSGSISSIHMFTANYPTGVEGLSEVYIDWVSLSGNGGQVSIEFVQESPSIHHTIVYQGSIYHGEEDDQWVNPGEGDYYYKCTNPTELGWLELPEIINELSWIYIRCGGFGEEDEYFDGLMNGIDLRADVM